MRKMGGGWPLILQCQLIVILIQALRIDVWGTPRLYEGLHRFRHTRRAAWSVSWHSVCVSTYSSETTILDLSGEESKCSRPWRVGKRFECIAKAKYWAKSCEARTYESKKVRGGNLKNSAHHLFHLCSTFTSLFLYFLYYSQLPCRWEFVVGSNYQIWGPKECMVPHGRAYSYKLVFFCGIFYALIAQPRHASFSTIMPNSLFNWLLLTVIHCVWSHAVCECGSGKWP